MTVTLTYPDIRAIAVHFDQTHRANSPAVQDYAAIKFIQKHEQTAGDVNNYIIEYYLPTNPSVAVLLDFYKGVPETNEMPVLRDLNLASKAILTKLGQTPSGSREELICFKQLIDLVFKEYFTRLTPAEKLAIVRKLQALPQLVIDLENISPIQNLKEKTRQLNKLCAGLKSGLDETESYKLKLQLIQFSHYSVELEDESWQECSARYSLNKTINNQWIVEGMVALSALLGLFGPKQKIGFIRASVQSFIVLFFGLFVYEYVLRHLAGAVVYGYRSYYHLNARDTQVLHQRIDQFISTHKERIINQPPSPALSEKWRNHAIAMICTPKT